MESGLVSSTRREGKLSSRSVERRLSWRRRGCRGRFRRWRLCWKRWRREGSWREKGRNGRDFFSKLRRTPGHHQHRCFPLPSSRQHTPLLSSPRPLRLPSARHHQLPFSTRRLPSPQLPLPTLSSITSATRGPQPLPPILSTPQRSPPQLLRILQPHLPNPLSSIPILEPINGNLT